MNDDYSTILTRFFFLAITMLFVSPAICQNAYIDSLDTYLNKAVSQGFSGVILIAKDEKILFHRAYSPDRSLTPESNFWIGSLTKPFTASAIMKLQEQGKLRVGDPISRHLENVPANKSHITIHHLLTHTSGIGTHYTNDGTVSRDDAISKWFDLPVEHEPGDFNYSNDGYNLLALLISVVSGQTFEEFMTEHILDPAGMVNTGYWWEASDAQVNSIAPVKSLPRNEIAMPNWGFRGSTGIYSNAEDLRKWGQFLKGEDFLSDFSKEAMFAPHFQMDRDVAYGYGWIHSKDRGTRVRWHNGAESGIEHYSNFRWFNNEGLVFIMLSNANEELTWEVFGELENVFYRE